MLISRIWYQLKCLCMQCHCHFYTSRYTSLGHLIIQAFNILHVFHSHPLSSTLIHYHPFSSISSNSISILLVQPLDLFNNGSNMSRTSKSLHADYAASACSSVLRLPVLMPMCRSWNQEQSKVTNNKRPQCMCRKRKDK
jgi:hypothetical protein